MLNQVLVAANVALLANSGNFQDSAKLTYTPKSRLAASQIITTGANEPPTFDVPNR
jgi:hypothetical protein